MEQHKLGNKIQVWATNLGFTLPDGSVPPVSHFALLIATPHRRQLWKTLLETIQSRQKVENMRKQILVAELLKRRNYSKCNKKQGKDRLDLWEKQNDSEIEIKETKNAIITLERNILTRVADSLFQICKLSEHERHSEDCSEKSMLLKLLMKQKKIIIEDLERSLLEITRYSYSHDSLKKKQIEENLDSIHNEILDIEDCECSLVNSYNCKLLNKIEDLCKSGIKEELLWEEVIKCRGTLLQNLSLFLEEVKSSEKSMLRKKEMEVEKNVSLLIKHLKQRITEKSLQVLLNSAEGKLLEGEVEKLGEKALEEVLRKPPHESSLNDTISYFAPHEMNATEKVNEEAQRNLKSHLNVMGLRSFEKFLKEELKRLEEEIPMKTRNEKMEARGRREDELRLALKTHDSILEEIDSLKSKEKEMEKEIPRRYLRLQTLLDFLRKEAKVKAEDGTVEEAARKLQLAAERQTNLISEAPSDAFRTFESFSGFEGESKKLLSALLISPVSDVDRILSEIDGRKKISSKIIKFTREREKLAGLQKKIQSELSSISCFSHFCAQNFKESEGILSEVSRKTDGLNEEINFVEKILKNWVEQPYRLMIPGKGLKDYEDKYRTGKH